MEDSIFPKFSFSITIVKIYNSCLNKARLPKPRFNIVEGQLQDFMFYDLGTGISTSNIMISIFYQSGA